MKNERGFVYVATGAGYIAEAIHSAIQLKKIHPNIRICLISDEQEGDLSIFDDLILLEKGQASYTPIDKVHCVQCPYEEAVFLDSDTWAVGKIDELFAILKKFDLALLPETRRGWGYKMPEVPRPFAEFNTGVIVFRNSLEIRELFKHWETVYWQLRKDRNLKSDQPSFRYILWNTNLRATPIPSEYHFLANSPNYLMWEALLFHGRGNLSKIAILVNKEYGGRVYIPHLGVLQGFKGKLVWLKNLFVFFLKGLQFLGRKNLDPSKLAPKKWWRNE